MPSSKESLEELSRPEYWNERYGKEDDQYDWLRTFASIKPFLAKHLPDASSDPKIVQLGCGNSVRWP